MTTGAIAVQDMPKPGTAERRRFQRFAAAGISFQGGSAAVDSSTIMAALVYQLTGSPIAVGAVTAILRIGWLIPSLLIGYLVGLRGRSMPYFVIGAFGRAGWIAILACLLAVADGLTTGTVVIGLFAVWSAYSLTSGIVAVPYNDIVARSIPSERRSRLLAVRFFGGGILALAVTAIADRLMANLVFPLSYAGIAALASVLMFLSSALFLSAGEPEIASKPRVFVSFLAYLREGAVVFRTDRKFRGFVIAQWCGGGVMMAMPFYIVEAVHLGLSVERAALLLGAQTVGALASNLLWGWWGDRHGKKCLLRAVTLLRIVPPLAMLLIAGAGRQSEIMLLTGFLATFFLLGALMNGVTIAVIGYLMEISPDHRRPAYSGYFNALSAPAYLLPLAAGVLAELANIELVFVLASTAVVAQYIALKRI